MAYPRPSPARHTSPAFKPSTSCSFKTFWRGFVDWWAERTMGGPTGSQGPSDKEDASPAVTLSKLVIGLVVLVFAAVQFAPLFASGLSVAGTAAVARATVAIAVTLCVALGLGVPAWMGWRIWSFSKAMCLRGQELEAGIRKPVRPGL